MVVGERVDALLVEHLGLQFWVLKIRLDEYANRLWAVGDRGVLVVSEPFPTWRMYT